MTRACSLRESKCFVRFTIVVRFCVGLVLGAVSLPAVAHAAEAGSITGVVTHAKTKERVEGALVVLQCTCLPEDRDTMTNAQGLYAFRDLPPGKYRVQVFKDVADVSKVVDVPRDTKLRANFSIDPGDGRPIVVVVKPLIQMDTKPRTTLGKGEIDHVPLGSTDRDWTGLVEATATSIRDGGGVSIAGMPSSEQQYRIEGANANSPNFGTVGASIVIDFLEAVDIQESGYEAELGGATGGQVSARRVSGTNKNRGIARFTYTPRLARPRFIVATDNAVRAVETPDYHMQGVVMASGPIKEDKLFWSAGIEVSGQRSSLVQSFHRRLDLDGDGGFEGCPYENGTNDCAPGTNYIATEKFAEQSFRQGRMGTNFMFGLDWVINPKHRIRGSVLGNPRANRRSFRRPVNFNLDPSGFGTTPNADPLGGASRVANGIVNDHFGWDRYNSTIVSLEYLGRVLDDKLEIDAGINYGQFTLQEAWKVDDPSWLDLPATEEFNGQGANLFQFLDDAGRLDLVPGVKEACNDSGLPGMACPTRQWISGGIGQHSAERSRRVGGRLAFTHFFEAAGSHQLKYGTQIEHEERRSTYRYSGSNAGDFHERCGELGLQGRGEWCYDSGADDYRLPWAGTRVNNHRYTYVNTDNPDGRTTVGYGRVRKEQGELRAIATALGAGARVDEYDETVSTQNYGVYLQDRWAVTPNLFLNAGVRWDMQDMRDIMGDRALFIWDNVAPRVGVVYDWTGEGRSRLFASYGWFYQTLPLQLNSRVFGGLVHVMRSYRAQDCRRGEQVVFDGVGRDLEHRGQPTEWCVDHNTQTGQLTEGAVVPRLRGMYNQQFQMGYEQEVIEDLTLGVRWLHQDLGRAVEDISPDGGLNFIIANPGESVSGAEIKAKAAECDLLQTTLDGLDMDDVGRTQIARDLQRCLFLVDAYEKVGTMFDKPRRNYDAFTFEVKKRLAKNWLLMASYTYSRLIGNYDGFMDPISGAINLGASSQFDIPELVRNSFGPLTTNSPHRVIASGFYSFDLQEAGRLTVGSNIRFQSGFPINFRASHPRYPAAFPIYVLPRGSAGRIEPNYAVNLQVSYTYPLPNNLEIEVATRLFNVTNAKAVMRVDEVYSFQNTRPVGGGDLGDLKHTKILSASNPTQFFQRDVLAPQGNFGVETAFQMPLSGQFDLILRF